MKPSVAAQLAHFQDPARRALLTGIQRGLEKECLRINAGGYLSEVMHPKALGSTLTHPHITTDYSEALMEFITPPTTELDGPVGFLSDVHRFVYHHLGEEVLWGASMPCMLTKEENVPIAYYGTSNIGRMKYIYRVGLGHRYGRYMQTIAGVHYNFSYPEAFWREYQILLGDSRPLQDFITERYFHLIRNYLRQVWVIPYLFGASPALCACFVKDREHSDLAELSPGTLYAPYATALRLGDLGYQNKAQADLHVSYNTLDEYVQGLEDAIRTPDPDYAALGVCDEQGNYQQLSDAVLQVENEYYAGIRPKRVTERGERPALALKRRGVEYVEVRSLDLNPYAAHGIHAEALPFLDCLLLLCLFSDSPPLMPDEKARLSANTQRVVNRGREPGLTLDLGQGEQGLRAAGEALITELQPIAELLDQAYGDGRFGASLKAQAAKFADPSLTPSARLLADVKARDTSFFRYAMQLSQAHRETYLAEDLSPELQARFEAWAAESLAEQAAIEAADDKDFPAFLADYYK
ncbi:MAG: glutamate--cysteine ligase [Gammaproteobacteria bacterium]|nr:glutamate--cysteine ligase [Gammaproteobacteria bacterium]